MPTETEQQALDLLSTKLAGGRIINPGGEVGKKYQELSERYYASGQDMNSVQGLKERYAEARAERNPNYNTLPQQKTKQDRFNQLLVEEAKRQGVSPEVLRKQIDSGTQEFTMTNSGKVTSYSYTIPADQVNKDEIKRRASQSGRLASDTATRRSLSEEGRNLQTQEAMQEREARIQQRRERGSNQPQVRSDDFPLSQRIGKNASFSERATDSLSRSVNEMADRVLGGYTKGNQYVSERIPTYEKVGNKLQNTKQRIVSATSFLDPVRRLDKKSTDSVYMLNSNNEFNKFLGGAGQGIYTDIQQKPLKNVALFGLGSAVSGGLRLTGLGIKTYGGAKALSVSEGALGTAGFSLGSVYAVGKGKEIYNAPTSKEKGAVVGIALKDLGVLGIGFKAGQKTFDVSYDLYRTRGLTNVPTKNVVAPEYFIGQKYPSVKQGTRAGSLRKEFYESVLPNELKGTPRGFSASPDPLPKETTILQGTSEVPGLFSAPKVSPAFLRVGNRYSKFSFDSLVTGEGLLYGGSPTATRLKFNQLDYTPGVTKRTKLPTGKYNKAFFESQRGSGKTFIPGAKTEKEAIITADSLIKQTGKNFYFNFEGRRVVVPEYEILKGTKNKDLDVLNLKDVLASSSSSRIVSSRSVTGQSFLTGFLGSSKGSTSYGYSPSKSYIDFFPTSRASKSSSRTSLSSSLSSGLSSSPSISSSVSQSFSSSTSGSGSPTPSKSPPWYPYRNIFSSGGGSSIRNPPSSPPRYPPSKPPRIKLPFGKQKNIFGSVELFVKEKGIFKSKGLFPNVQTASTRGQFLTGTTINRSFKIKGGNSGVPFGYRRSKKKGQQNVFVELSRTAISQRGERDSLNLGKMFNGKSRKKKMFDFSF